jgi:hypothetical protein
MAFCAALLGGAACDEGEGGGDVTLAGFNDALIETYCDLMAECPAAIEGEMWLVAAGPGGCVARMRLVLANAWDGFTPPTAQWEAMVARGTATWDEEAARSCLDQMVSGYCGGSYDEPLDCARMLRGTVAAGGACHGSEECNDGWCDDTAACPGVCVAYVAPGGECSDMGDLRCGLGYECVDAVCVAETPRTLPGAGGECNPMDGGPRCQAGLYCDGTSLTCQAQSGEGGACADDDGCTGGMPCVDGLCRSWTLATTVGAECGEATLTVCDPLSNLACDEAAGRCVTAPAVGASCASNSMCALGAFCDDASICRAPLANDSACDNDSECQSLTCYDGVCRSPADAC